MSSGHTSNGYVFATTLGCASMYALATLLPTHVSLPDHTHRLAKRASAGVEIGVGVALALVAVLVAILCMCGHFPLLGNFCCCSRGVTNYDDGQFQITAQHHPNDPENNLEMQPYGSTPHDFKPYDSTGVIGREDARQHVSELGARPAPEPRRERTRERRDRPRRDQADRLGALTAAHENHGRMASQETLVDRPSDNSTESRQPETKDITD